MRKRGFIKIISQNFFVFKKTWISTVFLMLIEPMLYLSVFGFGVGQFINNINGQSYLDFFFTGYLCISTAMVALMDSYNMQQSRLAGGNIYASWLTTPLTKLDIFLGETLWSSAKGTMAAIGTCSVGLFLGVEFNYFIFPVLLMILISIFTFSCFGSNLATSNFKTQFRKWPLFVILVSMIMISGLLFPVNSASLPIQILSYFFPLTHAIQLSRLTLIGHYDYVMILHFAYVLASSYFVFRISFKSFKEKVLS